MYEYKAKVVRVIDGDTVVLDLDLGCSVWLHDQSCRLYGIDTPEVRTRNLEHKHHGLQAKAFVERYLYPGRSIVVRTKKDRSGKYGRYLVDIDIPEAGGVTLTHMLKTAGFVKRDAY